MDDIQPYQDGKEGELLTDDERLLRIPRWQGETKDLYQVIRGMAMAHHLAPDDIILESEAWFDFVDEMVKLVEALKAS